jgi:ABC-type Fe3+/spermidine/putrescine transport system ATPase subunit
MRGFPKKTRRAATETLAEAFEIASLLERRPYSLSGGERQRVALARTLAVDPALVLLDEPLSSLDSSLRRRLRAEIRDRLRFRSMTAILVTHDAEEAFAVADRVLLMNEGGVEAQGKPEELYESPPTAWSAAFMDRGPVLQVLGLEGADAYPVARTVIGSFRCTVGLQPTTVSSGQSLYFPASSPRAIAASRDMASSLEAKVGVRAPNRLSGRVLSSYFAGRFRRISLACPIVEGQSSGDEFVMELELPIGLHASPGEKLELEIAIEKCKLLPGRAT